MVGSWAGPVLKQYVDSVVLDRSPVKRFEELLLCLVGFISQVVRRPICPPGLQQSASTHKGTIFADVNFERDEAEEEMFDFVMELARDEEQVQEAHGKLGSW